MRLSVRKMINALIKRVLSYRKRTWEFEDYPIDTWSNPNAGEGHVRYGAGLTNWMGMVGHGETPDHAINALREAFVLRKGLNHQVQPRPGVYVPFKFATTDRMEEYREIAEDFLFRMFGLKLEEGFYSDESRLRYFVRPADDAAQENAREHIVSRTLLFYNVDISDIYHEPIWKVFKRIQESKPLR